MKVKTPIEFRDGYFWVRAPKEYAPTGYLWAEKIKYLRKGYLTCSGNDLVLPTYADIINDPQSTFPVRCVKDHKVNLLYIDDIHRKGEVHRRCDIFVFQAKYWKRCLTAPKTNFKEIETSPGRKLIIKK